MEKLLVAFYFPEFHQIRKLRIQTVVSAVIGEELGSYHPPYSKTK
jgi:hypothetical protein